ncbi:MAG: PepSY domain-containing protein [bacterium]|nr:PepSY domain-containing protein [bacterium]
MAKITMAQAMEAALAAVPGQVLKAELDDEKGFLLYEIKVVTADKTIMKVKVDAGDGKVLATEQDK